MIIIDQILQTPAGFSTQNKLSSVEIILFMTSNNKCMVEIYAKVLYAYLSLSIYHMKFLLSTGIVLEM